MSCFPFVYDDSPDFTGVLYSGFIPREVADPIGSIPVSTTVPTGLSMAAADRLRNQK